MNEKVINNKGVVLYTEHFGDRESPVILLLAGATVSMLYWDEAFCRQLAAKGFFVIRYDNRDVGKSTNYESDSPPYDIVDLTDDAIAILDGYGIESAHFVGMSLGGLISQIAALQYPTRVSSLVLMATGPWGDSEPNIPAMDPRILDFHAKASGIDWSKEDSVVEYLLGGANLMRGKKYFEKERIEKQIRAEFKRANNYTSMFHHAGLQGGEIYYNRLNEINHPTLVIHGTDDQIWHFKHTAVLLEKINNAQLVVLTGTGHELHREDWETITTEIANHIANN